MSRKKTEKELITVPLPHLQKQTYHAIEKYSMTIYKLWKLEEVDGNFTKTLIREDIPNIVKALYLQQLNAQEFTTC